MKKLLIFCIVISSSLFATAQQSKFEQQSNKEINNSTFWINVSSGLNNANGIFGVQLENRLNEKWSGFGAVGIGTWGNKLALGGRIYRGYPLRSAISISLSTASGIDALDLQTNVYNPNGVVVDTTVSVFLKPTFQFNISWQKYWKIGKASRFYIEAGYSMALNRNYRKNFEILDAGYTATRFTERVFRGIQPGGIIIALGFSFGM